MCSNNNEKRVRLDLIGITYNQIESGVYALILQEAGGTRRIPIIIGYPEAQSIECKLQEVVTPRPLTHDLMTDIFSAFNLTLKEVEIYRLPNGVFAANLYISSDNNVTIIDSRSSDAIALAIRVGAPIYTLQSVMDEVGFTTDKTDNPDDTSKALEPESKPKNSDSLEKLSDATLQSMMDTAVANENYERAAQIKSELDRRKQSSQISDDSSIIKE